jgi:hypothetical protein
MIMKAKVTALVTALILICTIGVKAQESNQKADGYRGIWFTLGQVNTQYGDKYSGGLGTYTVKHIPLAIYSPEADKTFFVYGGTPSADQTYLVCMAGCYDHKTGMLQRPVIVHDKGQIGVTDPHDNPTIQLDKDGYNDSLVYSYSNDEQGIFEVGEVSLKNCTNAYPYAMALKRCMDRVILKNSKLAYSGIYADSEAEEFKNEPKETKTANTESADPVVVLPEGKSARQALVDYCTEASLDINIVAKRYKLNNGSDDQEFINALAALMAIRDTYKEA